MAQLVDLDEKEIQNGFAAIKSKPYSSQAVFFLNVFWDQYGKEKEQIFQLFLKFVEQQEKFGAKKESVTYPAYCKVLQDVENTNERVKKVLQKSGDRSTMSKVYQELGFKLTGDITLIECLLFIYNEKVNILISAPQSPGDTRLRKAKLELNNINSEVQSLLNKKSELEALLQQYQNENQPMKAIKCKQDIAKVEDDINKGKVDRQKRTKNAEKELKDAENNLLEEQTKGTDASNWFKQQCQNVGKPFSP